MLRTGQLLGPAPNPASRPRTGASLPGTLASPRTGLTPAGCPQLVDWLRHHNLLVVMAPNLLDAPPDRRAWDTSAQRRFSELSSVRLAKRCSYLPVRGSVCLALARSAECEKGQPYEQSEKTESGRDSENDGDPNEAASNLQINEEGGQAHRCGESYNKPVVVIPLPGRHR
jgi:hypothetical protein